MSEPEHAEERHPALDRAHRVPPEPPALLARLGLGAALVPPLALLLIAAFCRLGNAGARSHRGATREQVPAGVGGPDDGAEAGTPVVEQASRPLVIGGTDLS